MKRLQILKQRLILLMTSAILAISAPAQQQEGMVMRAAGVLYDSHSVEADAIGILSKGYPVIRISEISGWVKVQTDRQSSGWVKSQDIVAGAACIVTGSDDVNVHYYPSTDEDIFMKLAPRVIVEHAGSVGGGGWHHVVHADGETGYVQSRFLWCNSR